MRNAAHSAWLGELMLCLIHIVSSRVGNTIVCGVSMLVGPAGSEVREGYVGVKEWRN